MAQSTEDVRAARQSVSRIAEGFFINGSRVFICIEARVSLAWDDVVVDLA